MLPVFDFHIHATAYRPARPAEAMSVDTIIHLCAELGYDAVGVLDHLNERPGNAASGIEFLAREARQSPFYISVGVGAEVDIVDEDGRLSWPPGFRERTRLNFAIASIHRLGSDVRDAREYMELCHRAMMATVEGRDGLDAIGHPWCRTLSDREGGVPGRSDYAMLPEEWQREFIHVLAEAGVALEVNGTKSAPDFADAAYRRFMGWVRDAGVRVLIGSDAHRASELGRTGACNAFLAEMGFGAEQIWRPSNIVPNRL